MRPELCSKLLLIFILLIGTAPTASFGADPDASDITGELRQKFAAAQQAERAGNFTAASEEYEAILKLRPNLPAVRQSLAITYHLQNRFAEAITHFRQALSLDDTLWGSHLFLGMDLYKTNQFEAAVAPLKRSIELNAQMAEFDARFWLGVTFGALQNPLAAIPELRRAAQLRPADLETLYQLTRAYDRAAGIAFERIGTAEPAAAIVFLLQGERFLAENRQDLARMEFRRAVALRPDIPNWTTVLPLEDTRYEAATVALSAYDARALLDFAVLCQQHGAALLAETAFTLLSGATGASGDAQASINSGRKQLALIRTAKVPAGPAQDDIGPILIQLRENKAEQALKGLQQIAQADSNPWVSRLLLRAYSESGQVDEAERLASSLLDTRPNDLDVLYLVGCHYKKLATQTIQKMIDTDSDAYRVHELQGGIHEEHTDFGSALREYQAALSKNPNAAGLRYAIGNVYAKSKQYEAAEQWLTQELQRNPHHALAHARLGSLYVDQGKADDAVLHLEEATRANPTLHMTRLDLARAYILKARYDDAARELTSVAAADPENDRVHYLLATVFTKQGRSVEAKAEMAKYGELTRKRLARAQAEVQSVSETVK